MPGGDAWSPLQPIIPVAGADLAAGSRQWICGWSCAQVTIVTQFAKMQQHSQKARANQRRAIIQPRLTIGPVDDPYEREAERMTDQIMRMPVPVALRAPASIQRCAECAKAASGEEMCPSCAAKVGRLQRDATTSAVPEVTPQVEAAIQTMRGGGQPLDADVRAFMEPRFGYDFSAVRVHTSPRAARTAAAIGAQAFTVGNDITFGAGQYRPGTKAGKRLIAHELMHVVQSQVNSNRRVTRTVTPAPMSIPPIPGYSTMYLEQQSLRGAVATIIALGEVGVREMPAGSNRGPCVPGAKRGCVDAYTGNKAALWCAHFVSWAFEQTGYSPFGHKARVADLRSWAQARGYYVDVSALKCGLSEPKMGDVFTMQRISNGTVVGGHTGFVIRYDKHLGMMETVEGNNQNAVRINSRNLSEIDGIIRVIE